MSDSTEDKGVEQHANTPTPQKIPFQFIIPTEVLNHFSNYAMVQYDSEHDTFTLSFWDVQKPPLMGTKEEIEEGQERLKAEGIPVICLARIILNPPHFRRYAKTLQTHLEKVEAIQKQQRDKESAAKKSLTD